MSWLIRTLCVLILLMTLVTAPEKPLENLEGRVMLLYDLQLTLTEIKAINVRLIHSNSFLIQIWRWEEGRTYSLAWQQELPRDGSLSYKERMNYTLNIDPPFTLTTSGHRLGIYCIDDPLPIQLLVANGKNPQALVSPPPAPIPIVMETGVTRVIFSDLTFPYDISPRSLTLCDQLDCGYNITRPTQSPRVLVPSEATRVEDHFLLSIPFLTGMFVWLIVLTVLLLTIVILIICLFFRDKDSQEKDDHSSHQDPGEWYVVTDDPPFSLTFSDSANSSRSVAPGPSYSRDPDHRSYPRERAPPSAVRLASSHVMPYTGSREDRLIFDNYGYHEENI